MMLGGRVAEEIVNGSITTGAYDDLHKVQACANAYVKTYGMSKALGYQSFDPNNPYASSPYLQVSDKTAELIDKEVADLIQECVEKTRALINTHRDKLIQLSETLFKKETLNLRQIVGILGKRPFKVNEELEKFLEYQVKSQDKEKGIHEKNSERKKVRNLIWEEDEESWVKEDGKKGDKG